MICLALIIPVRVAVISVCGILAVVFALGVLAGYAAGRRWGGG